MGNTYFEQVPVEVVKKICKERIQLTKEASAVRTTRLNSLTAITANRMFHSSANSAPPERATMPDESSDGLKYPQWQEPIQAALLEFDPQMLSQRIAAAEAAISARLDLLSAAPDGHAERLAIQDGLRLLSFLRERPSRML